MTRALIVESSGNLWGSERALLDLLGGMKTLEVAVCCPPRMPLTRELEKRHVRTLPYYVAGLHEKSRSHRLRAAIGLLHACLEYRPDVIYLNQSGSYKVTLPAATLLNLPIVAHVRIFEDAVYLARQSPGPHRLRGLIAISSAVEAEIRHFHGLNPIPVHRIYDAYTPMDRPPAAPVSEGRISKRIACVGRLVRVKGQDLLVHALKAFDSNLECLMVGEGEEGFVQDLKQMASNVDSGSSVQWVGFVHDVVPLLRTCSVLACPSHLEPLGRVILEAWDAGAIPVAFAGSGGAAEIIAASDGGILYEEQRPEALAKALRYAVELDPGQAACLVDNGRSWMAKNCNPTHYGELVYGILSAACR
jgi:glycosyltransferase involved in cell wall biosynthesis